MPVDPSLRALTADEVRARRERGRLLADDSGRSAGLSVHVLGTFALDLLPPFLVESLDRAGIGARVGLGPFGRIAEEALDAGSALYGADPGAVVLVASPEDLLGPLYARPVSFSAGDAAQLVEARLGELTVAVEALLERLPAAACYVALVEPERAPCEHVLAPGAAQRGAEALAALASGVRALGSISPRVVVVDTAGLDAAPDARDARLWYVARMRLAPAGLAALAERVARHAAAFSGRTKKVVAVDLDDVLWGGVVGEVGHEGVELGEEGVGLAFQDFQRELLKLHDLGVLLVLASKNNVADVDELFAAHPGMVLRREHFVAERVNWNDKATSLGELAEELSLGLDSFVFLDDNPVERDWVRSALPEVTVPELPEDPVDRPGFVAGLPYFQRLTVTDADRGRAESYRAQRSRSEVRQAAGSLDEFLESLEQSVVVEAVHSGTVARAAQLCQRTNQFNLTTKRYTLADVEAFAADPEVDVYTVSVADRYGDSGITGVAVLRAAEEAVEIDTLLLSCRVLGRRVEDAVLAFLAGRARERGARVLVGRYEPSPKNGQAERFYPDRGFREAAPGVFELELASAEISVPGAIDLTVPASA